MSERRELSAYFTWEELYNKSQAALAEAQREIERLRARQLPPTGNIRISIDAYEAMLIKGVDTQAALAAHRQQVRLLRAFLPLQRTWEAERILSQMDSLGLDGGDGN